jgi:phenylalanine-4-hydroxylase
MDVIDSPLVTPLTTSPARTDALIDQNFGAYTAAEHALWDHLYQRQLALLNNRAHPAFLQGLERLSLGRGGVPNFEALSKELKSLTGWEVCAVSGLISDEAFFSHLAQRRFVAGRFIRRADQIDYLPEPDVFHDVFGHVPLLTHPVFADYMQAYGEGGLRSLQFGALHKLARLYWYTVEFGLIHTAQGLRIYGAGITSSAKESVYALESATVRRRPFELTRVMQTNYRIDDLQAGYFVIDSFEQLLETTLHTDFAPLYRELESAPEFAPGS